MDRLLATALITGASSGIGRELARVFAENHHQLVLVARDRIRLEAVATELHQKYLVPVRVEVCDLADRAALEALVAKLEADHVVVDVLVNNAGVGIEGPFVEIDWSREREMIDVNVGALVRLTKAFLPQMTNRRSGKILQVASTAAFQPGPYLSLYFATKAFVLSFSEGISAELRGSGVSVTTLCPGPTHTDFERRLGTDSGLFDSGIPVSDAASVAAYGYAALMKRKRVAVHGAVNRALSFFSRILPNAVVLFFLDWAIGRKVVRRDLGPTKPKNFPAA